MRVLQLATLFSPDGAYGGPTRVATVQSRELLRRGHDVVMSGAARGYRRLPPQIEGVPSCVVPARQVLPGLGYAGLAAPGLTRRLARLIPPPDVVHVHLARDLVTLPAARWALARGLPLVVQTHGMIDPSGRLLAKPLDRALTGPVLRAAARVYCLTDSEVEDIQHVAGRGVRTVVLPNGVPEFPVPDPSVSRSGVVYVGRLHARKRPMLFVQMAQESLRRGANTDFELIGPDEGEGAAVAKALRADDGGGRIRWTGPLPPSEVGARLARAAILVNTTDNERFGMSVIEAMAAGCTVVVGASCGLSGTITRHDAGLCVEETKTGFASAVLTLLEDPARCARLAERGTQAVRDNFDMVEVVDRLLEDYRDLAVGRDRDE